MPESLTLRNIQLPASNSAPYAPAGATDEPDAVDFQAVLAQQLGAAPPAEKLPTAAEAVGESGGAQDDEPMDVATALPLDSASAALQLMATPSALGPVENMSLRRVAPEQSQEWDSSAAESAVAPGKGAGVDSPMTTATIAAGTEEITGPSSSGKAVHDALQPASELRPELPTTHGMERRADMTPPHAPKEAAPLEQPISMARHSFSSDIGDRVLWMASNNRQVAELRVDPPQLGPVEVRLSINGEQASLTLVSANAGVREALQASIPRLQDMIQSIGLELGSVTVGSESSSRQQEQPEHQAGRHPLEQASDASSARDSLAWPARPTMVRGLVDIFA